MPTRRDFLAGAATTAGAAALFRPAIICAARAAEPIAVVTPFGFIPDFIEIMNAQAGGHFAKEGIDAKVIGAHGTAQAIQQLVAGQAQFGRAAAIDMMRAVGKGAPLVSISTLYQGSTFQIVSLKSKPVPSGEALKGKTVGLVSVGGTTETFIDLILAKVGLKKDDIQRQVTGNSPGAIEYIKQGRVDCFICSLNVVVALERAHQPIEYWSTDRYAPMPGQIYAATRETLNGKPDLTVRFLRAIKASVDELMTKPIGPIFQRAAKEYDIPGLKDLDGAVDNEKAAIDRLWLSEGRRNLMRNVPKLWVSGVEALRSVHLADIKDPATLYTNSFVDRVLKA